MKKEFEVFCKIDTTASFYYENRKAELLAFSKKLESLSFLTTNELVYAKGRWGSNGFQLRIIGNTIDKEQCERFINLWFEIKDNFNLLLFLETHLVSPDRLKICLRYDDSHQ